MRKRYLLSDSFEYSKLITHDAGGGYAQRMGWETARLSQWNAHRDCVLIVDNRISPSECEGLEDTIARSRDSLFMLRVVDPYSTNRGEPYYRLLDRVKNRGNVRYLTPYQPTELVEELSKVVRDRLIVAPYPFIEKQSVQRPIQERQEQVVFSGARHPEIYPERESLMRAVRRNPLLWGRVHSLKHPGYPDIGQSLRHSIVGEHYIDFLSRFVWMFLSPSRCRLEFLKYSECANAGCVPIGQAPDSFSQRMRDCFVHLDFERLGRSIRGVLSMPVDEVEAIAGEYRRSMADERNPVLLNQQLDSQLLTTM